MGPHRGRRVSCPPGRADLPFWWALSVWFGGLLSTLVASSLHAAFGVRAMGRWQDSLS